MQTDFGNAIIGSEIILCGYVSSPGLAFDTMTLILSINSFFDTTSFSSIKLPSGFVLISWLKKGSCDKTKQLPKQ